MYIVWKGLWWALIVAQMICSGGGKKKKKLGKVEARRMSVLRLSISTAEKREREKTRSVYLTVASRIWSLWPRDWQAADFNYASETNTVLLKKKEKKKKVGGVSKGGQQLWALPLSFYMRFRKWRRKKPLFWTIWRLTGLPPFSAINSRYSSGELWDLTSFFWWWPSCCCSRNHSLLNVAFCYGVWITEASVSTVKPTQGIPQCILK